jgi:multidrug efflux pump subunit AcrA (membrane-fusion protein)
MRKFITIIASVVLLLGSFLLAKYLIDNKQKPQASIGKIVKTVFTETVENTAIPILITTNGSLEAKNKIDIFSEVQGVLIQNKKEFKSGTYYKKGEILIQINSEEFYTNLQAEKSNLFNALTAIIPDIRLDFPDEAAKWEAYLANFDLNKPIDELPSINSDKEKFFISGRGIFNSYYNVKNLMVKLSKYTLRAPFDGVLTEALVNPGSLIRPGQKLGEFIDPTVYEISVSVKSEFHDLLEVGKTVELFNLEKTNSWIGKVIRINGKVDASTQTVNAFIEVKGDDLKEGQYLEVLLQAKEEPNAYEIPRNLLIDNSKLYIVKDSILSLVDVELIFEHKNSVVIKGLEQGSQLLSKPVPGAHNGMLVKIYSENLER